MGKFELVFMPWWLENRPKQAIELSGMLCCLVGFRAPTILPIRLRRMCLFSQGLLNSLEKPPAWQRELLLRKGPKAEAVSE